MVDSLSITIPFNMFYYDQVWQYELSSFQAGDTKLGRFLPKNQYAQRKLLNFEFWINSELSIISFGYVDFF